MKRIYLDYAASTPMDPRVLKAMQPYFIEQFGNPGSLHSCGQESSAAVFTARQAIATTLNCHYSEVIFTASATEANNLAIRGSLEYFQRLYPNVRPQIMIPEIEHDCVLQTVKGATEQGAEVVYIPVSKKGIVEVKHIAKHLNERTMLISVMYANNEIGTIQPIAEIAELIRAWKSKRKTSSPYPLLHTDAVQAFEYLATDVQALGVDMMTISGHKMYGPKGIGALYIKNRQRSTRKILSVDDRYLVRPIILGGGQEEGLRSGTENTPAIVGFGVAAQIAAQQRAKESARLISLRDHFVSELKKIWPKMQVNGSMKERLPNHINVYIPGETAERMLTALDLAGVVISSGSACAARTPEPSRVLLALGMDTEQAKNSLRITLGRLTTAQEVRRALVIFKHVKDKMP